MLNFVLLRSVFCCCGDATTLRKIFVKAGHNSDKKIIMKTCLNPFVRAGRNYGFRQ